MKPILFNTENVRAILEGTKTVTRRVVKFQRGWNPKFTGYIPDGAVLYGSNNIPAAKAPYKAGDILWVRETWNCLPIPEPLRGTSKTYWYKADGSEPRDKWRPSIFMPREAARIFLRVTDVRVERLDDMTTDDVFMEGVFPTSTFEHIRDRWHQVWDSTIKPKDRPTYGWEANPWVWVIEFERISGEMEAGKE